MWGAKPISWPAYGQLNEGQDTDWRRCRAGPVRKGRGTHV